MIEAKPLTILFRRHFCLPVEKRDEFWHWIADTFRVQRKTIAVMAGASEHRSANSDAGHRVLSIGYVEDPGGAEPTVRLGGGAEDALVVVDADAGHEDGGISLHALDERLADGFPIP